MFLLQVGPPPLTEGRGGRFNMSLPDRDRSGKNTCREEPAGEPAGEKPGVKPVLKTDC